MNISRHQIKRTLDRKGFENADDLSRALEAILEDFYKDIEREIDRKIKRKIDDIKR